VFRAQKIIFELPLGGVGWSEGSREWLGRTVTFFKLSEGRACDKETSHKRILLEETVHLPRHSVALHMLGSFTLWFRWYGFNCGWAFTHTSSDTISVIALSAVNTTLTAEADGVIALFTYLFITEWQTGEISFNTMKLWTAPSLASSASPPDAPWFPHMILLSLAPLSVSFL